jgi:hypothetical protein
MSTPGPQGAPGPVGPRGLQGVQGPTGQTGRAFTIESKWWKCRYQYRSGRTSISIGCDRNHSFSGYRITALESRFTSNSSQ